MIYIFCSQLDYLSQTMTFTKWKELKADYTNDIKHQGANIQTSDMKYIYQFDGPSNSLGGCHDTSIDNGNNAKRYIELN